MSTDSPARPPAGTSGAYASFVDEGFFSLGPLLPRIRCRELMDAVHAEREFSSRIFLSEDEYRRDPKHKGVNPKPGRNFVEKFDLRFLEQNPVVVEAMTAILGTGYRVLNKTFVVGVPESWMPEWLLREADQLAVANLGAYVKPEYRDISYFHGIDFHQDIIDWPDRAADFVTLYVYLDDTHENTSPLFVVPRSHRFGATVFPHRIEVEPAEDRLRYSDGRGNDEALGYRILTGPAGSVHFWHACVLHGTQPNTAAEPRISVRYLIEKGPGGAVGLIDELNRRIQGALALPSTRDDLDDRGVAVKRGNTINRTGRRSS